MKIFFYGLFMDQDLLATKGIEPADVGVGFVDGYALRIGRRATLIRQADSRAYGAVMDITPDEARHLYSDQSVADYVPEPVTVTLAEGGTVEAACYNLPPAKIAGTNAGYAGSLLEVARKLGFPATYLDQIRRARDGR